MFQMRGLVASLCLFVLCFLTVKQQILVEAYLDEGHMLVAAVAKLGMSPEHVTDIERVLSLWENDYPGMSSIPVAANWARHIMCKSATPGCEGLKNFDNIRLFDSFHDSTIPYNVDNVVLPPKALLTPDANSAHCVVNSIQRSLTGEAQIAQCSSSSATVGRDTTPALGSAVSWNIMLRIFIHVFGDLHQPLHTCTAYTNRYPKGDLGGKLVVLENSSSDTLNKLWDSVLGLHGKAWPAFSAADAETEAARLIKSYPKSQFKTELATTLNPYQIATESCGIAKSQIYKDLILPALKWNVAGATMLYTPTDDYIKTSQGIAERRLVLAGYRLEKELTEMAPKAKLFLASWPSTSASKSGSYRWTTVIAKYIALLLLGYEVLNFRL